MTDFERGIINLVKSCLTGERISLSDGFDWQRALKVADEHRIESMLYYGAVNSEITLPEEVFKKLEHKAFAAMAINVKQTFELDRIFSVFEQNGIYYAPIKGIVLKNLYPKPELRTMGDADIIIKTEQYPKINETMLGLGFEEIVESDHDFVWTKGGRLKLELHKCFVSPMVHGDFYEYYKDTWSFINGPQDGKFRCDISDEKHLIYLFTHYSAHYRNGGIGIKHLCDFYIYLKCKSDLDMEYIEAQLEKLKLLEFFKNSMKTVRAWFDGEEENEVIDFITTRIFNNGAFGTSANGILSDGLRRSNGKGLKRAKLNRLIFLVFLPYTYMKIKYPFLKKFPILLPVMWIVRGFDTIFNKRENIIRQKDIMDNLSENGISEYRNELQFVGLDFDFKE